jgi:hypothetical protein
MQKGRYVRGGMRWMGGTSGAKGNPREWGEITQHEGRMTLNGRNVWGGMEGGRDRGGWNEGRRQGRVVCDYLWEGSRHTTEGAYN